jgi:anti-anti-sigma factor
MVGAVVTITTRADDGSVVVNVRGEVDVSSAGSLRQIITDAAALRPKRIVVDLLHVTFIDSTGLSVLIGGRSDAQALRVAYIVRNPSGFVTSQLRKTGLYKILITGS